MAVQCANCGEELLGSVNRCWRCGQTLVAHAGPADVPPIRRAPLLPAAEAVLVDEPAAIVGSIQPIRRGSPFVTDSSTRETPESSRDIRGVQAAKAVKPPRTLAAQVAGAVSILMGFIALLVCYPFPPGALGIAGAGIGFGIYGLYSPKRGVGLSGLILCCIALAVAAFLGTVQLYEYIYGVSPFAPPVPMAPQVAP